MTGDDANHWLDDRCARAFWDQHRALPYKELLQDTADWLAPGPGERWLDLGCGGGQLTKALWRRSGGRVAQVLAMDCAAVNAAAIAALAGRLDPAPRPGQIEFRQCDFSHGLSGLPDAGFDGIVAGLSLCYAEDRDPATGAYTDAAFNRLFAEIHRVLKPGGRLVFSTVVPDPRWWRIVWRSLRPTLRLSRPLRVLANTARMLRYGRWLNREAGRGRFHYLPLPDLLARLGRAGFAPVRHRLTYAGQAYLLHAAKPAVAAAPAA
jgi:SAM-dependent methyltransferase